MRVVVGGLYGNPKRFVGRVVALLFLGNSLGFRAVGAFGWFIAHSETLNVHFSGVVWVLIWIWGNLGSVRARRNLERSFCMGGNLGFMAFVELRGAFGGYGNLKGLFGRVETSAFMLLWNFGVVFGIGGNFGVSF